MKTITKTAALLSSLLLASCAMDVSSNSLPAGKAVPSGTTVHLAAPCDLVPIDNIAEEMAVSAKYFLHPHSFSRDEILLPKGQKVKIVKYRKFLINEAGTDTGAIGVVKGGANDGARFVYVFGQSGPKPW